MAEMVIKIDPGSNYGDGDVLAAFNRRRIEWTHAQMICGQAAAAAPGTIMPPGTLIQWLLGISSQYRFDRLTYDTVRRSEPKTGRQTIFRATPNEAGEYIHAAEYIARRRRHARPRLFGTEGRETWYGGRTRQDEATVAEVWAMIQEHSPHRLADHQLWPAGRQDLISHLFIAVDDFDDDAANELVASEYDETDPENPVLVKKRKRQVEWEKLPGINAARILDIRDKAKLVDVRAERTHDRAAIVKTKRAAE